LQSGSQQAAKRPARARRLEDGIRRENRGRTQGGGGKWNVTAETYQPSQDAEPIGLKKSKFNSKLSRIGEATAWLRSGHYMTNAPASSSVKNKSRTTINAAARLRSRIGYGTNKTKELQPSPGPGTVLGCPREE